MNAKACLSAIALVVSSSFADGAVTSRDWKTPGDRLLTYDTVSGREWLDLTETQLFKFPGTSLQDRYQAILANTGNDGSFAGFTLAMQSDVYALAMSAGIDTTTLDFDTNSNNAQVLISLLGDVYPGLPDIRAVGYLRDHPLPFAVAISFVPSARDVPIAGISAGNIATEYNGVWLYRVAIPEPASLGWMLLIGFFAAIGTWRWKNCQGHRTDPAFLSDIPLPKDLCFKICVAAALLFVAASSAADGAVISRDWKTPGDGLLTYDTVSGREWLEFSPQLTLPEPRYDAVAAELGPGGMFEGFQVGTNGDVAALATSAGIALDTSDFNLNGSAVRELMHLIACTDPLGTNLSAAGLTSDVNDSRPYFAVLALRSTPNAFADVRIVTRMDGVDRVVHQLPVFLYRVPIPEPNGIGTTFLLIATVLFFALERRLFRTHFSTFLLKGLPGECPGASRSLEGWAVLPEVESAT